jgi:hypothetical protein
MAGYYDRDRNPNGVHGASAISAGTMNWPKPHIGHVPEYQVSGFPFAQTMALGTTVAGDVWKLEFPMVTRWVIISAHKNTNDAIVADDVKIGFSETGVQAGNAVDITTILNTRLELKTNALWFYMNGAHTTLHIEVLAGLTSIESSEFVFPTSFAGIDTNATYTQVVDV